MNPILKKQWNQSIFFTIVSILFYLFIFISHIFIILFDKLFCIVL